MTFLIKTTRIKKTKRKTISPKRTKRIATVFRAKKKKEKPKKDAKNTQKTINSPKNPKVFGIKSTFSKRKMTIE